MRRREFCILSFLLLFFSEWICAQGDAGRISNKEQIDFILRDTLPVDIQHLPRRINTKFSEFNPVLLEDSTFYFSMLRAESYNDFENLFDASWSTGIYSSKLTISGYSKPVAMPNVINNPKYYNCNATFSKDKSRLYFTRCVQGNTPELQCMIWESRRENGRWTKPVLLNRRINLPGTNTTQPFLVEYEDYDVLYFASDRPKGFGQLDIWYSVYKNNRYEDPVNAGSIINTPGNEVTPFYTMEDGILYFSSDFHPGLGGYDVFYSRGALSAWTKPVNVGYPLNSLFNDIYFTVNKNSKSGYFSSNRPTKGSSKSDTCCNDIFYYEWEKLQDTTVSEVDTTVTDTVTIVQKIKDILPLTLYFHNDEPDAKSTAIKTNKNYQTTLSDYIALKDLYKTEYAKGLKGEEKIRAQETIERFFVDSVERGFVRLERFSAYLLEDLKQGNDVRIMISGYASPLHNADYNMRLSSRRISSLENYIREYKDGIFLPYLEGKKANRLEIMEDPKGNTTAARYVSDNVNDQRNSVYSIAASLERRIQITAYESEKK